MKKILTVILLLGVLFLSSVDIWVTQAQSDSKWTAQQVDNNDHIIYSYDLVASATLTYADANEHSLATPVKGLGYKDYFIVIKITYDGVPNDVDLTFGMASCPYELTGANGITYMNDTSADSDWWSTEVIDLLSGGAGTEVRLHYCASGFLNGNWLYFKYQYSGDPGNDPTIEVELVAV